MEQSVFEKEKLDFDQRGFCVVKSFFNKSELSIIEKNINDYIRDEVPNLKGKDVNFIDGELNSIHSFSNGNSDILKLAERGDILSLAEIFLDAKPELRKLELFAKPAKRGLPSPIHQDNFYWCIIGANALTFWIALDECSYINGGLTYYAGSHKLGLIDHVNSYAPGSSQKVPEENFSHLEPTIPTVKPGDILVHHSLTLHGSAANNSDQSRRGLTIQFKDANASYDEKMLQHYSSNLKMQVKSREIIN